jgi:23S rRNA pseudouridine2605 synthase/16S rRNA pseudouridine516 synthase
MLKEVGHPVLELVRRAFGPLHLGTLPVGQMRDLTKVELGAVLALSRSNTEELPEYTEIDNDDLSEGEDN